MSEKKSQEAKKGRPSSAGRRNDKIAKYFLKSAPRNKERQLRKVVRWAIKLSGNRVVRRAIKGKYKMGGPLRNEKMAALNVAISSLASGEKKEDGIKRFNSVFLGIPSSQRYRWDEARERRLVANKAAKIARRETRRAQRRAEQEAFEALVIAARAKAEKKPAKPKAAVKPKPKPKPKTKGSQPS